jgi:hypothetical protein
MRYIADNWHLHASSCDTFIQAVTLIYRTRPPSKNDCQPMDICTQTAICYGTTGNSTTRTKSLKMTTSTLAFGIPEIKQTSDTVTVHS